VRPNQLYVGQIFEQWGRLPAWLPDRELSLGDIGYETSGGFDRMGNVADLGVALGDIRIEDGGATRYTLSFKSNFRAQGDAHAALGGALAQAAGGGPEAKLTLAFQAGGGFAFDAMLCQTHSVANHLALGEQLLRLAAEDKFDRKLCVVTELVVAQRLVVLIGGEEGGEVELKLAGSGALLNLPAGADLASLDADVAVQIGSQRGMNITVARHGRSTPLFAARRIRRSLLGRPAFKAEMLTAAGAKEQAGEALEFGLVAPSLALD
jgi:hypothetical protein